MDFKQHFSVHVLNELYDRTRFIRSHFNTLDPIKTRRWRCLSCDTLCEYNVKRIVLNNGQKVWEINVDIVKEYDKHEEYTILTNG